jgi:hypothetical protein
MIRKVLGGSPITLATIGAGPSGFAFTFQRGSAFVACAADQLQQIEVAFLESGMHDFLSEILKLNASYLRKAQRESGSTSSAMDELFGG